VSRAFVNEDPAEPEPKYDLPARDDPDFDAAAARALIQGANAGDSLSAETATGYRFGEQKLRPHVEQILAEAIAEKNDRLEQLARRFLKTR
jgi:hypothetical protein